jgi:hypothetical protein
MRTWPTFKKHKTNYFFLLIYEIMNLYVRYILDIKEKNSFFYFYVLTLE